MLIPLSLRFDDEKLTAVRHRLLDERRTLTDFINEAFDKYLES